MGLIGDEFGEKSSFRSPHQSGLANNVLSNGIPEKRNGIEMGDLTFFHRVRKIARRKGSWENNVFPIKRIPKEDGNETKNVVEGDHRQDIDGTWIDDIGCLFAHV